MDSGHLCSRYPQRSIFLPFKVSHELSTSLVNVPFEHYLYGGSVLWASIVVLTVASLLSLRPPRGPASARNTLPLAAMALSVLGLCLNGVAGLACVGVVAGSAILVRSWHWRALAFAAAGMAFFFLFRYLTGLDHVSAETGQLTLVSWMVRTIQATLAAGGLLLSFRALAILTFAWATRPTKTALALFCLALVGLFIVFGLERYPLSILAVLLAGYAAAPAAVITRALAAKRPSSRLIWETAARCFKRYAFCLAVLAALQTRVAWYPFVATKRRNPSPVVQSCSPWCCSWA